MEKAKTNQTLLIVIIAVASLLVVGGLSWMLWSSRGGSNSGLSATPGSGRLVGYNPLTNETNLNDLPGVSCPMYANISLNINKISDDMPGYIATADLEDLRTQMQTALALMNGAADRAATDQAINNLFNNDINVNMSFCGVQELQSTVIFFGINPASLLLDIYCQLPSDAVNPAQLASSVDPAGLGDTALLGRGGIGSGSSGSSNSDDSFVYFKKGNDIWFGGTTGDAQAGPATTKDLYDFLNKHNFEKVSLVTAEDADDLSKLRDSLGCAPTPTDEAGGDQAMILSW